MSSICPTCPICEAERKPKDGFLTIIGAPERRALKNNRITTLEHLSKYSEKEVLKFHGMVCRFNDKDLKILIG